MATDSRRDLRHRYGHDYRILKARSGREALEAIRQLKQRGAPVALFIVDERMPEMTGTELLREVLKLYPDSRRVLLTAYSDTQAAIAGINDLGLDHYLLKPWTPPSERLYPVLDDLLSDWTAHVRLPYDGIRVAGDRSSPRSYAVKDFLSSNQVPYQWIDLDRDPSTRELIRSFGDASALPVVLFPDGSHLTAPSNRELAAKIGMQTRARLPFYDVAVVGAGPAGLAAALYGSSEGLRTILVEQNAPGGQASWRTLDVPGIEPLLGMGVYYGAAKTEAATYRGQDVCVLGAGNSAGQGALFFSRYARRVTLLVRGGSLGKSMSQYLIDRIAATPNIEVLMHVDVAAIHGEGRLEKVVIRDADGAAERELDEAAIFIFIGAQPRTELVSGWVELDEKGFVLTGPDVARRQGGWTLDRSPLLFETSVPGVFAAGDVRAGSSKRVAAAVGEGSGSIAMVHRYLETV